MRWFARFLLKQVAAGSWVSQIRRSVGRRGEALPSDSRVDLGAISRFAEYCENQVGLGKVVIFDGWVEIRSSNGVILVNRSE